MITYGPAQGRSSFPKVRCCLCFGVLTITRLPFRNLPVADPAVLESARFSRCRASAATSRCDSALAALILLCVDMKPPPNWSASLLESSIVDSHSGSYPVADDSSRLWAATTWGRTAAQSRSDLQVARSWRTSTRLCRSTTPLPCGL